MPSSLTGTRFKRVAAMVALCLALGVAGPAPAANPAAPVTLPQTEQWDIPSAIAGRTYRVSVWRPSQPAPKEGYPVVIMSDGDVFFPQAVGQMLIRTLGEVKPAIIVGIAYPTMDIGQIIRLRNRDLTPTPFAPADLEPMKAMGITQADSGGGPAFYRFITEELRPQLAARYPIDPADQTLFGHSLGGLFTLHVLFNHPASFRNFVAASPSIWWDDRVILKDVPKFEAALKTTAAAPRLLMTVGGAEASVDAVPIATNKRDDIVRQIGRSRMVGNMQELLTQLQGISTKGGFSVTGVVLEGENHLSVQAGSLSRALTFALAEPTFGTPCPAPCTPPGK